MKIKIGTRKSQLALAQTQLVVHEIKHLYPQIECQIIPMSTQGDLILDKPLLDFGGKGAFISEFETALLNGTIDIAVHSGKDLPAILPEGLEIIATPKRGDHRDVLLSPITKPFNVEETFVVGTGSLRRKQQSEKIYPNITCKEIRGNVNTRLKKMEAGQYHALILASAGIERLNIDKSLYSLTYFNEKQLIPAAAQGIIAIEAVKNRKDIEFLTAISHQETMLAFTAERKVLSLLNAGCHQAVGVFATVSLEEITLTGFLGQSKVCKVSLPNNLWEEAAKKLAGELTC